MLVPDRIYALPQSNIRQKIKAFDQDFRIANGLHLLRVGSLTRVFAKPQLFAKFQEMYMSTINPSVVLRGLMVTAICGPLVSTLSTWAAGTDTNPVSRYVTFGDLDITSSAGAAELYARLHSAAVHACSYYWFKSDAAEANCIRDAIANAVIQVNQPALVAAFNARNTKPLIVPRLSSSH